MLKVFFDLFKKLINYILQKILKSHGLFYDVIYLIVTTILALTISDISFYKDHEISRYLISAFIVLQVAGSILKRGPMYSRISGLKLNNEKLGCFSIMVLIFYGLFVVFVLIGLFGIHSKIDKNEIIWGFITATICYFFIVRALFAPKKIKQYPIWQEYTADILLALSAIIISQLFWEPLISEICKSGNGFMNNGTINILNLIIYTFLLLLIFVVYYIIPRMVILFEDAGKTKTWLRFVFIFVISYIRIVFAFLIDE